MKIIFLPVSAFVFAVFATLACADDSSLTAEQLAAKFMAQEATRGLVIAPADGTAAPTADGATTLPADTTYASVDPNSQVNFQIKCCWSSMIQTCKAPRRASTKEKVIDGGLLYLPQIPLNRD